MTSAGQVRTGTPRDDATHPSGVARVGSAGPTRTRTRVMVLDDHELFAESLDLALSRHGYDVRVAKAPGTPGQAAALLGQICRTRPAVVLLDLHLGRFGDGARLIAPITQAGVAVVVLTGEQDEARWGECLLHGARSVISKTGDLNEILRALRRLEAGLPLLGQEERAALITSCHRRRLEQQSLRARLSRLTTREAEVLGHLTLGRPVRDIAARSVVSEATVRTQVKSILAKLGVCSQLAAVGLAHEVGWRSPVS